jgi:hypothetical protein
MNADRQKTSPRQARWQRPWIAPGFYQYIFGPWPPGDLRRCLSSNTLGRGISLGASVPFRLLQSA